MIEYQKRIEGRIAEKFFVAERDEEQVDPLLSALNQGSPAHGNSKTVPVSMKSSPSPRQLENRGERTVRTAKNAANRKQSQKMLEIDESAIQVFDFEKDWHLVEPHLNHPKVKNALIREGFDLAAGPWTDTTSDYWAQKIMDRANDAIAKGDVRWEPADPDDPTEEEWEEYFKIERQFEPKPDSYEWYQCFHGCHWLAPFLRELGKRAFPSLTWKLMKGDDHSLAFGTNRKGNIRMIFDILNFKEMSAIELIQFASRKGKGGGPTRVEEIKHQEKSLVE